MYLCKIMVKGVVLRSTGSWYSVLCESGSRVDCRLKGKLRTQGIRSTNPVAVGDYVYVEPSDGRGAVIAEILQRDNYMVRKATRLSKSSHIIAANIDMAFLIVTLAAPRTSLGFIDRFLVTAGAYHIPAALIFNKIDLLSPDDRKELAHLKTLYRNIGYPCYETSATQQQGIEPLWEVLKGKVSLFSGHSGAGKSALINVIEPTLDLRTGVISDYHQKGMHTTTFAEMFSLSFGGYIIDTPGIKEFGMIDLEKEEVSHYFPEMLPLIHDCNFHNCTHVHEPNCAVKEAIATNKINGSRYRNYCSILNDESFYIADWK